MAYASGKYAWGISDRSGRRYRLREMKVEWTGAKVGPDEFEPKHPQLFPTPRVNDPQALRDPRPEQDLKGQRDLQYGFRPVGFRDIPGITPPNALVANGQVGIVNIFVPPIPKGSAGISAVGTVTVVV